MLKKLLCLSLIFVFATNLYANRWRRYPTHYHTYPIHNHNRSNQGQGITPGAATAIGLGVGILGFVIGRSTKSKEVVYKDQKIQCKDFDIKVTIDGEEKKAKVTKCRTDDGEWKIPD
jgi:hypothetical protein